MRRTVAQMANEFRRHWKNYVFQSLLAAVVLLIALWVLKAECGLLSVKGAVIVASIGATAFIVFAMPGALTAKPRNVIGGHAVGIICGALGSLAAGPESSHAVVAYALAVGLSIFVMVVTDTEHPPASGTALGIAIAGFSWGIALAVVTAAVLLAAAHRLLRSYLRDLD